MSSAEPAALVPPPRRGRAPWVPILLYHRVVPTLPRHDPARNCVSSAAFAGHLRWLARRGYRSLALADVDAYLAGGAVPPRRAVAITFDDGYEDNYTHAWPLLRRYGFAATVFLIADAVGGDNGFDRDVAGYEPATMLSAGQIREMRRSGIVFGSHGRAHRAPLTALNDRALDRELVSSRRALEGLLDAPVDYFAYPYSKVDARIEAAVARAGYRLACAGVGTRFVPTCLHRVEPPSAGGAAVEARMVWRRLKRTVRAWQRIA